MSSRPPYREELLHWVWETARVDLERLKSTDGQAISIFKPGTPNHADGPDFLNAHIQIGNLKWFGDVEIHWRSRDWRQHGHQNDPNFNRVVLHVVWEHNREPNKEALRQDGSPIPTLHLKEFVSQPLQSFLGRYQQPDLLPCSGHLSFISEDAFKKQLEKAERQYFEKKVNDLLAFWDPSLPSSKAWIKLLAIGLFDGLGISHNRAPMRNLCQELYPYLEQSGNKTKFIEVSRSLLNLQLNRNDSIPDSCRWSHKGSRPANQPASRVPQAACSLWYLYQLPFKTYLSKNPEEIWRELNAQIDVTPGLGTQRKDILFGTVLLPAFFILGTIFACNNLKNTVFEMWRKHQIKVPESYIKPFENLDLPAPAYRHSLGIVHQFRAYCRPRHCRHCKVFKSVIYS